MQLCHNISTNFIHPQEGLGQFCSSGSALCVSFRERVWCSLQTMLLALFWFAKLVLVVVPNPLPFEELGFLLESGMVASFWLSLSFLSTMSDFSCCFSILCLFLLWLYCEEKSVCVSGSLLSISILLNTEIFSYTSSALKFNFDLD